MLHHQPSTAGMTSIAFDAIAELNRSKPCGPCATVTLNRAVLSLLLTKLGGGYRNRTGLIFSLQVRRPTPCSPIPPIFFKLTFSGSALTTAIMGVHGKTWRY